MQAQLSFEVYAEDESLEAKVTPTSEIDDGIAIKIEKFKEICVPIEALQTIIKLYEMGLLKD